MSGFTWEQGQAVRAWVVDRTSDLISSSYENQLGEIQEAVNESIRDDMGYPRPSLEDYRRAHRNGDMQEYAGVAGLAVTTKLGEWITGEREEPRQDTMGDFLLVLLDELLELSDRTEQEMFGQRFLPEPDDLEEWARDNAPDWVEDDEDDKVS